MSVDKQALLEEILATHPNVSLDQNNNIILIEIDHSDKFTGNIKIVVRKIRDLNSGDWLPAVINLPVAGVVSPHGARLLVDALNKAQDFALVLNNIYRKEEG